MSLFFWILTKNRSKISLFPGEMALEPSLHDLISSYRHGSHEKVSIVPWPSASEVQLGVGSSRLHHGIERAIPTFY